MSRPTERVLGVTAFLLVVAVLLGCGGIQKAAQKARTHNQLLQIGLAYQNYQDQNKGKSPSGVAELQPFGLTPDATTALQSGQLVVIWDADVDAMRKGQGQSGYVLGYESSAPAGGGAVLLADGDVRQMTVAEFNALPKAPTKAPGAK
jgi:hypothetical protein